MATRPVPNQGKGKFLREFLSSNRDAKVADSTAAWKAEGHDDGISESLFGKIRSELGLTKRTGSNGRATDEAATLPAKGKSKLSPKEARGEAKKAEKAPSPPDVRDGEKGPSKSFFVGEVLGREPRANLRTVNEAWASAGHEGAISPSIYYKIKKERVGTGETTPGESEKSTAASASRRQDANPSSRETAGAGPGPHRVTVATPPVISPSSGDREKVLHRVEDGIDDLIGELKQLDGMEAALESLKKVRRVVVRSHDG